MTYVVVIDDLGRITVEGNDGPVSIRIALSPEVAASLGAELSRLAGAYTPCAHRVLDGTTVDGGTAVCCACGRRVRYRTLEQDEHGLNVPPLVA